MRRGRIAAIGLATVVVAGLAYVVFSGPSDEAAGDDEGRDADGDAEPEREPSSPDDGPNVDDPRVRASDPEVRALAEELRRRIREARRRREAEEARLEAEGLRSPVETGGSAVNSEGVAPGSMDPEYIRDAVRAVRPLLRECYELALHEDQSLEGRLVVEFDIEGEPDAGGIVEDTRIHEDSTLTHPTLEECIAQTLYTLELPAPEGGGMVHVRYPFGFSNDEDEGGEE